jgi:hypothetical protein
MKPFAIALASMLAASSASAASITLDFDTPATGSNIIGSPLLTSLGTITAVDAELVTFASDPEFNAAGASGNKIDHLGSPSVAKLLFDFDVASIGLIYGGNTGDITIRVRDASSTILDSFFQASTSDGPAGPIALSGIGIRSLEWFESDGNFAGLDNIEISDTPVEVPEPWSLTLLGLGAFGVVRRIGWGRRRFS